MFYDSIFLGFCSTESIFYGFLSVAKYCFRSLGNKANSTDPCLCFAILQGVGVQGVVYWVWDVICGAQGMVCWSRSVKCLVLF